VYFQAFDLLLTLLVTSGGSSPRNLGRGMAPWQARSENRAFGGVQGQLLPLIRDQDGEAPKAETLSIFGRSMEAVNLPTFLKFGNAKKSGVG